MDKLTVLFAIGLLLEGAGFLLGSVEHIPIVFRLVSPNYVEATQGIEALDQRETLQVGMTGFPQLSRLFLVELAKQNPSDRISQVSVRSLYRAGRSGIAFGDRGVTEQLPVTVVLSNGQELKWNLVTMRERAAELKFRHLFRWGLVLFLAGAVLQVVGFTMGRVSQKAAP